MSQPTNLPAVRTAAQAPAAPAMLSVFSSMQDFEGAQRIARAIASSALVPEAYQGEKNLANVLIAMEYAGRCNMSVIAVMQNLNIIQGKPSWSATFLISSVNSTGKFTPLRYEREDRGKQTAEIITWEGPQGKRVPVTKTLKIDDFAYRAWATDKSTGEKLYGPWVSMKMANEEGWTSRAGNKYRTMPEQMLMYRSASFFTRIYCPEVSMGMHTSEEVLDYVEYEDVSTPNATQIEDKPAARKGAAKVNAAVQGQGNGQQTTIVLEQQPADDESILPDGTFTNQAYEGEENIDGNEYEVSM